jgi:peptide/nickel transport system substrate-binding protein
MVVAAVVPAAAGPRVATSASGGTFRVISAEDVDSLDPGLGWTFLSWQIASATCSTLMGFPNRAGPAGAVPTPRAAAGFPRISRDGRTYVFTVRKGLRFSNGSRINAANFAAGLRRALQPRMQSPAAAFFSDVTRMSATGRTLRIGLKEANGDLLTRLALPFSCPVPVSFPAEPGGVDLMLGSGPYYVASRVRGRQIVLERNRFYRGTQPHRAHRVVVTVGGTRESNIAAVEQGRADYAQPGVPAPLLPDLVRRYGINKRQLFRLPGGGLVFYLAFNTQRPLFRKNVPLRRAVNFALDRHELARVTGRPLNWKRTDQLVDPTLPGFVNWRLYPLTGPNLTVARRLARGHLRAGRAVFYTTAGAFFDPLTQVIVYNLERIGLHVEVKAFSRAVQLQKAGTRGEPFDIALGSWMTDYPDPGDVLIPLLAGKNARQPTGNLNLAYFDEPTYNRRFAAAARLVGLPRFRAFERLERDILRTEAPVAPFIGSSGYVLLSKRAGCFAPRPAVTVEYGAICLE